MQIATFTGKMVVHCHKLKHEDQGMMGYFKIDENGNNQYACAESLEPKCYRNAFDANAPENTEIDEECKGSGSSAPLGYYLYITGIMLAVLLPCCGVCFCIWRTIKLRSGRRRRTRSSCRRT